MMVSVGYVNGAAVAVAPGYVLFIAYARRLIAICVIVNITHCGHSSFSRPLLVTGTKSFDSSFGQ